MGTGKFGLDLLEGCALLEVYIQSGFVPRNGGDSGIFGASEQIWWAVEGLADALWEVWLASGTLVPQSWPPHLERCLPVVVHRGLRWCQAWQGIKKRLDLRWG